MTELKIDSNEAETRQKALLERNLSIIGEKRCRRDVHCTCIIDHEITASLRLFFRRGDFGADDSRGVHSQQRLQLDVHLHACGSKRGR